MTELDPLRSGANRSFGDLVDADRRAGKQK
jgi:hypothetical protein